jgi:hypothetical protein
MILNLHPKCANPSCAAAFGWMTGGKLFRFHRESKGIHLTTRNETNENHTHSIDHFWLCERCSIIYTLKHEPGRGVTILSLWPELPAAKNSMHLPSS